MPLLFKLELTSKAAEAAGLSVPMPTWAKVFALINKMNMTNTRLGLVIMPLRLIFKKKGGGGVVNHYFMH